jgi:hypothetical protein
MFLLFGPSNYQACPPGVKRNKNYLPNPLRQFLHCYDAVSAELKNLELLV